MPMVTALRTFEKVATAVVAAPPPTLRLLESSVEANVEVVVVEEEGWEGGTVKEKDRAARSASVGAAEAKSVMICGGGVAPWPSSTHLSSCVKVQKQGRREARRVALPPPPPPPPPTA